MEIKILGTQSPYNTDYHNCPGFLITDGENKVLLDCGSGSHRMLKYPDDLNNLTVIITHLHRDHYNDLFNLQYASLVFHGQKRVEKPVMVYMPHTPESIYNDESTVINIGNLKIEFCKVIHPMETYAVKVTDGKSVFVYTSDTSYASKDTIVNFAKDADILLSEASLLVSDGFPEINSHLTAKQAATIAKEAGAQKLIITHFWPEKSPHQFVDEAKEVFENTFAAEEGDVYKI